MAIDTPIARLRDTHTYHAALDTCTECEVGWPCDVVAALDALEADISAMADGPSVDWWQHTVNALQARIDAATVLIRRGDWSLEDMIRVKAWLAGDKEEHGE